MKPFKDILLAGAVPVLVALYTCWDEPKYILSNLVYYAAPQILWWLLCIIWWSCWGPPRNRGLFIGGIVPVDLLLLYVAFSPGESEKWFYYFERSPVALVLGGLAGGLCGKLFHRPQPGAPPNGGPAPPPGNSSVIGGPPSVS
jgi:hypothetical protein